MLRKIIAEIIRHIFIIPMSTRNPEIATKVLFRFSQGYPLDMEHPQTFNAKLQVLKLTKYYNNPIITQCVDKYRVRQYLRDKGYGYLLNDLVGDGFYDSAESIDFDKLPDRFVLKCNHDCGSVVICNDRTVFDEKAAVSKLHKALDRDYWKSNVETQYRFVQKGIICEEYLENHSLSEF